MRIAVYGMHFLCLQMLPQRYPAQMMAAPNHNARASHNLSLRPFCQPGRNRWNTNTNGWRATKMLEVIAIARLLRRATYRNQKRPAMHQKSAGDPGSFRNVVQSIRPFL